VDMAVDPRGVESRSITSVVAPASAAAKPADIPQAPAPTITTSKLSSKSGMSWLTVGTGWLRFDV